MLGLTLIWFTVHLKCNFDKVCRFYRARITLENAPKQYMNLFRYLSVLSGLDVNGHHWKQCFFFTFIQFCATQVASEIALVWRTLNPFKCQHWLGEGLAALWVKWGLYYIVQCLQTTSKQDYWRGSFTVQSQASAALFYCSAFCRELRGLACAFLPFLDNKTAFFTSVIRRLPGVKLSGNKSSILASNFYPLFHYA